MDPKHEVTIFPIYDPKYHPRNVAGHDFSNYLDSGAAFSDELEGATLMDTVRNGIRDKTLRLDPGHYLLLEFNDDLEEFIGLIFTINPDNSVTTGMATENPIPRMTTWPLRS